MESIYEILDVNHMDSTFILKDLYAFHHKLEIQDDPFELKAPRSTYYNNLESTRDLQDKAEYYNLDKANTE